LTFTPIYHVNGPCKWTVDSNDIGYCTPDGVAYKPKKFTEDVNSDDLGDSVPGEVINKGQEVTAVFTLAKWDNAALKTVFAKYDSGTQGTIGTIGELMVAASRMSVMVFASPIDNEIFTLNRAYIVDEKEVNLNTKQKLWSITVRGIADGSGIVYTITNS
jgi:hypothetical protein